MSFLSWACALGVLAAAPSPSALQLMAERVAAHAAEAHPEAPLALSVSSNAPALAQGFATLLGAQLAAAGSPAQLLPWGIEAEAAAHGLGARSLLRVAIDLKGNELQVRGDLLGTAENFWSGKSRSRPAAPAALLAFTTTADDSAKLLVSQPATPTMVSLPLRLERTSWARIEGPVAALAMADADGDGRLEVLVLTDRDLIALAPDGKVIATHSLVAARAASTPRLPFGALAVLSAPPRILARLAQRERAEGVALDAKAGRFNPLPTSERDPVRIGAGATVLQATFVPGRTAFQPSIGVGAPGEKWTLPGPWSSVAMGTKASVPVLFVLENGGVERRGAPGDLPPGLRSGAGLAWIDLEADGRPELLVSSPEAEPFPEMLRVLSVPEGAVLAQWELSGSVHHVCAGDLDGDGNEEAIAAVIRGDGTTVLERIRKAKP